MFGAEVEKVFEGVVDFGLKFGENLGFGPAEALEVLNPLEVTDGDPAGVTEDVRDEEDIAAFLDDRVGGLGGGTVGGFGKNLTTEA